MTDDDYVRWSEDATLLAQIGGALFPQGLRVSVRLPKDLAEQAVAAWQRDDSEGALPHETPDQRLIRERAAALALIGLALENAGIEEGDDVVVELDAWQVGTALHAANEDGLLTDGVPPA
jgi:hypothetical protein